MGWEVRPKGPGITCLEPWNLRRIPGGFYDIAAFRPMGKEPLWKEGGWGGTPPDGRGEGGRKRRLSHPEPP